MALAEKSINILESTAGGLGIEEVDYWYKGRSKGSPDNVEMSARSLIPIGVISTTTATNRLVMHADIDLTKGLLLTHRITRPVRNCHLRFACSES